MYRAYLKVKLRVLLKLLGWCGCCHTGLWLAQVKVTRKLRSDNREGGDA